MLGLPRDMGEHLRGQRLQFNRVKTLEIFGFGHLRIEHVGIVRANIGLVIGAFSDCIWRQIRVRFELNIATYNYCSSKPRMTGP